MDNLIATLIFVVILLIPFSKSDLKFKLFLIPIFIIFVLINQPIIGLILVLIIMVFKYALYRKRHFERFDVVEDDVDKIVKVDENSFLDRLQNNEDEVEGVWSSSYLGKHMGLSKG